MTAVTARSNTSLRGAHTPPSLRGVSSGNLPLYSAFHVVLCPIIEVDPHVATLLGMTNYSSLRGVSRGNLPLYSAFHVVLCPITEVDPHVATLLGMTFCLLKRRRCAAITRNPNTSRVYFYIPGKKKYCSLFFNVDCFYYLCITL